MRKKVITIFALLTIAAALLLAELGDDPTEDSCDQGSGECRTHTNITT